jgi:hypothetical protein
VNATPPSPRFLQLSDLVPAELLKQQGIASVRCTKLGDGVRDYLQVVTRCAQAKNPMISPHSSAVPSAAGGHSRYTFIPFSTDKMREHLHSFSDFTASA